MIINLNPSESYDLRYNDYSKTSEILPLSSRIYAIAKTVFFFFKAICSFFNEDTLKIMKEHAACAWTGVRYKKLQGLANFHEDWTVPLRPENEALLRNLLDESPYPLDTLIQRNPTSMLMHEVNELDPTVTLGIVQGWQGERTDPAILIKISGESLATGKITKTVVVLTQQHNLLSKLVEFTLVKNGKNTSTSLFFKSDKKIFPEVRKEENGFQSLKQLLSTGQVVIDQMTWKLA